MKKHLINNEIKSKKLQLVLDEGLSEIKSINEALKVSEDKGLDLVEMSIKDGVSICKIMDYKKHLYDLKKKEKENSKNKSNSNTVKEIQFKNNIAIHDLEIKARNVERLLKQGYKVKISVQYRGREMNKITEGKHLLEKCLNNLIVGYTKVNDPKIEGNRYTVMIESEK